MALNDYEKQIIANIEEHGWFCVSVFDDRGPSYSYSVGFAETLNSPEFIIFGLEPKMMHAMLWELFRALKAGGSVPGDGDRVAGILSGYDCVARDVHADNIVRDYVNSAMWRWGDPELRGGPLQVRQLFWPDLEQGRFPWESGCDPMVRKAQPLLFQPRSKTLASKLRKVLKL